MIKKTFVACATALILGSAFFAAITRADEMNASNVAPIHWGKNPINNASGEFKNGKSFCGKKYIGRKTCIPNMNNTSDTLTFNASSYNNATAPSGTVVSLIGKDKLDSVMLTVQDTSTDGTVNTVYSGPANNREGVICNQDQATKAVSCNPWK